MNPTERLKLLFEHDETLLKMDTGLHITECPGSETEQEGKQSTVQPETSGQKEPSSIHPNSMSDEKDKLEIVTRKSEQHDVTNKEAAAVQTESLPPAILAADVELAAHFCPIMALSRYPYRHMKGELSQRAGSQFFDGGKFWSRHWDMYIRLYQSWM